MIEMLATNVEKLVIDSPAAIPADLAESAVFAIPQRVRLLSMSIRPVGSFDALSVSLHVSNKVDAGFAAIKTSTSATGELYVSGALNFKFCKVVVNSSSGASRTGLVVGIVAK